MLDMNLLIFVLTVILAVVFHVRARQEERRSDRDRYQISELKDELTCCKDRISELKDELICCREAQEKQQQRLARSRQYNQENDIADYKNQIRFISSCDLKPAKPVNGEASKVLYALSDFIVKRAPRWRLSFEVAMGAFIKTRSGGEAGARDAAFHSYNSKRVDFLLIDDFGYPKLVVEYHGSGHYQSPTAEDRMAVKRLALERAGIPLLEIPEEATQSDVRHLVEQQLAAA